MDCIVKELPNGLRTAYVTDNFKDICHIALTVGAGSSNETLQHNGMAHFIEHTLFKGTKKRKAFHILSRIDSVGGELNAFTTKEETCIYISVHNFYLERALELLSDLFYNSIFPEEELEKEKEVIKDEIKMYFDAPSEQIYDDFETMIFKNHPLGFNILGSEQSLNNIKRKDVLNFIKIHYTTNNIVLSASTPSGEKRFNELVNKYFNRKKITTNSTISTKEKILRKPNHSILQRSVTQSHCVLGSFAYKRNDAKRTALVVLNNLLGGPGMNSRLNLNIREKYGFTYQIESAYQAYQSTGVFSIYFSTEFNKKEKTQRLIEKELMQLCQKPLSKTQLDAVKRQFIGQLTLSQENVLNIVLGIGKSVLCYNKVDSFNDVITRINKLTPELMMQVANEVMHPDKLSSLNYINTNV